MTNVEELIGTEIHGWRLTRKLGRGADGVVYVGEKDGDEVAVKVFFPGSLNKNGLAEARERLELQIALIGRKHHANLVEVYAGGEDKSLQTLFLVMELVPGTSLDKLVEAGIPARFIAPLIGQLASAAEYLESIDLVHRDIKPANIVVSDDFSKLTLLDLGIVHHATEDDQGRISGLEFVATLRYSPHEFVWRTEETDADGAWRAVTFYQIGATLHDMVMRRILFAGHDTPRACLYDSVRERTPVIESDEVDSWLIQTAHACLLKDWRQRLHFLSWESFSEPTAPTDVQHQEKRIHLQQVRKEELRCSQAKLMSTAPGPTREQQLWVLNSALVLEIRTYLRDSAIFPKCRISEDSPSQQEHVTSFNFEPDQSRDFGPNVSFKVGLSTDTMFEGATRLTFRATVCDEVKADAVWTELFTVETAFGICRQSFLDVVELMLTT